MKPNLSVLITLFLVSLVPYSASAGSNTSTLASQSDSRSFSHGGSDRGGGSAIGSSINDVKEALQVTGATLLQLINTAAITDNNLLSPKVVKNERVKAILEAWIMTEDGAGKSLFWDMYKTDSLLQTSKCPSQTKDDQDASTEYKRQAPICFRVDRLARFPKWVLEAELVALAAHEYAHHYGFGEADARAIQTYIFNSYTLLKVQQQAFNFYRLLDNYRSRVSSGYSPYGSPQAIAFAKEICRNFAALEGYAAGNNLVWFQRDLRDIDSCNPNSFDPDRVERRLKEIEKLSVADFNRE
jgi:hypothetical protein